MALPGSGLPSAPPKFAAPLARIPARCVQTRVTPGTDKGYDVADLCQASVTPHVAPKFRVSAIDGRTTRRKG